MLYCYLTFCLIDPILAFQAITHWIDVCQSNGNLLVTGGQIRGSGYLIREKQGLLKHLMT